MLHFCSGLLPSCKPPLLRILPLLPQAHQGIETLAKVDKLGYFDFTMPCLFQAQQLVIVSPPPCSLLPCTASSPISLMVQPTQPEVMPVKSSSGPSLPVGSTRKSFLPPPTPLRRRNSLEMQSSIVPPISNSPFLLNSIIPSNSSLSCQYKPEESPLKHVNSVSSSNLGELAFRPLEHPALDQFDWPTTLNFSATKTQKKQEKEPKKGPNLERVRL